MNKWLADIEAEVKTDIIVILLAAFSVLTLVSIVFVDRVGFVGQFLNRLFRTLTGNKGSWVLPIFVLIWCVASFLERKPLRLNGRVLGMILVAIVLLGVIHLTVIPMTNLSFAYQVGWQGEGGGLLGGLLVTLLFKAVGPLGMRVVMATLLIAGIILVSKNSLMDLLKMISRGILLVVNRLLSFTSQRMSKSGSKKIDVEIASDVLIDAGLQDVDSGKNEKASDQKNNLIEVAELPSAEDVSYSQMSFVAGDEHYMLPQLDVLHANSVKKRAANSRLVKKQAQKLEETLLNFGVEAKVSKISIGPTITRYEIQTAPGTKVSKVTTLSDDIAMSLAAQDIRMEAPIPGKAAIGIEVPNEDVNIVYLREVLKNTDYSTELHPLTIALGQDISGNPVIHNLAKMPHLLIAGATGSGKSVCINVIINSVLFKAHPNQVRFLMIDPKRVELSVYNGIPHLLAPVVTDPKKAATALRWIVEEMEKRYTAFAEKGARDLERFNQLVSNTDDGHPLPMIVVIIDELADLMMVASSDVEDAICRLAQMGRAAGIHLVVGTQRPSVDVITGLIKANIPARIAFAVSSGVDSRTIIDINGAEKLLGQGDMLFDPPGLSKPLRVQGAYISDKEVESVVKFITDQIEADYEKEEFQDKTNSVSISDEVDELYPDAIRLIVEYGQASISMLQRRLHIGYTRAARIVDQLEDRGIVGPYEGSKPRQVYADSDAVRRMLEEDNSA